MSEHHSEISAYVACHEAENIADQIIALCEREGLRRVKPPNVAHQKTDANLQHEYVNFGIFPGRQGWHLLMAAPRDYLCDRQTTDDPIRFVSLCNALAVPGLLLDLKYHSCGDVFGNVLLEADGKGQHTVSGYMWSIDQTSEEEALCWHGEKISEEHADASPRLIGSRLPSAPDAESRDLTLMSRHAKFCSEFARILGGKTCRYWSGDSVFPWELLESAMFLGGPSPIPGGIVLTFEKSAAQTHHCGEDSSIEHRSREQEAFLRDQQFRYASGDEIHCGDEVRLDDGDRGRIVSFFATSTPTGIAPEGVHIEGPFGSRSVYLRNIRDLVLLARNAQPTAANQRALTLETLQELMAQGDADAQYQLGLLHAFGSGVQGNPFLANMLFREAAMHGHAGAQYELGYSLLKGRGILTDPTEASQWLTMAGDGGMVDAFSCLASLNVDWKGNPTDSAAVEWMTRAAESGSEAAQERLADWYYRGSGVPQSFEKAGYWLHCAAKLGHSRAQYRLGLLLESGEGVTQDFTQATNWNQKAAAAGWAEAQCKLAGMYEHGQGVPEDLHLARDWYRKAAERDFAEAQYRLGLIYRNGRGVEPDIHQARSWLEKAANKHHGDANQVLKELEKAGLTGLSQV